jgi:Fe-S oxidoreductase
MSRREQSRSLDPRGRLELLAAEIQDKCVSCGLCRKECGFLQRYGMPGELAGRVGAQEASNSIAFDCSLCRLCDAVCPLGLSTSSLMQAMRSAAVAAGEFDSRRYGAILNYERRGFSPRYTFYGLPVGCDSVFFPGCAFSGSRSRLVEPLYEALGQALPGLGIVLDCCCRPSRSLGRDAFFERVFGELKAYLFGQGVRRVLVACPNCWRTFSDEAPEFAVESVYERLASSPECLRLEAAAGASPVRVHDPCAMRFAEAPQAAVRSLLRRAGLEIEEMEHAGARTHCCGEGGTVGACSPDLARRWSVLRAKQAEGRRIATSCAGCGRILGGHRKAAHVLDLLFASAKERGKPIPVTKPPFTYLRRLLLKRRLQRRGGWAVTRNRPSLNGDGRD